MIHRVTLALLLVIVAMLCWVGIQQRSGPDLADIRSVVDTASEKVNLRIENHWSNKTMTTPINWRDSEGFLRTTNVPTERLPSDDAASLWKRHHADILAVQAGIVAVGGELI